MDVVEMCPINKRNVCTQEVDGKIHRCKWLMMFTATDNDGKQIESWRCAVTWVPLLQIETLQLMRASKEK